MNLQKHSVFLFLDGKRSRFPGEANALGMGPSSPSEDFLKERAAPPSERQGCVQAGGQVPRWLESFYQVSEVLLPETRGRLHLENPRRKMGQFHQICPSFHFNEKNALSVASDVIWLFFFSLPNVAVMENRDSLYLLWDCIFFNPLLRHRNLVPCSLELSPCYEYASFTFWLTREHSTSGL